MLRKCTALMTCMLLLAALSGCALLPQEQEPPAAPVVQNKSANEFTFCYVQKGDLIKLQNYTASFAAVKEADLSFKVSGLRIDKLFVELGDTVREGQLLAQLESTGLKEELASKQARIDSIQLSIEDTQKAKDLAMEQQRMKISFMEYQKEKEEADTPEEVGRPYDVTLESLQTDLRVAQLDVKAVREKIAEREIVAPFDGAITYIKTLKDTDASSFGDTVLTVSDAQSSMFVISTKETEAFVPGTTYTMQVDQEQYEVTVADPDQVEGADTEGKVYLTPERAAFDLEDGDKGFLTMELGRVDNCLYIDKGAVKTMNGQSFVYVQDENGIRVMKPITTGFDAGTFIQVTSGLEAEEAVILK